MLDHNSTSSMASVGASFLSPWPPPFSPRFVGECGDFTKRGSLATDDSSWSHSGRYLTIVHLHFSVPGWTCFHLWLGSPGRWCGWSHQLHCWEAVGSQGGADGTAPRQHNLMRMGLLKWGKWDTQPILKSRHGWGDYKDLWKPWCWSVHEIVGWGECSIHISLGHVASTMLELGVDLHKQKHSRGIIWAVTVWTPAVSPPKLWLLQQRMRSQPHQRMPIQTFRRLAVSQLGGWERTHQGRN